MRGKVLMAGGEVAGGVLFLLVYLRDGQSILETLVEGRALYGHMGC